MTEQELFTEAIVTPRRAFPRLADLRVIERPGWLQIITPSISTGSLNEVILSALDAAEADAVIDATIAEYRALGLRFRWNVGPDSAPPDLGERLARRGMIATWGRAMARSTDIEGAPEGPRARSPRLPTDGALEDPAIEITEVEAATIDPFLDVMARGWDLDPQPLRAIHVEVLAAPERRQRLFLASWDGEPAATASYVAFPRSAYLIGGVVLPRFRGRGLYRALVRARLADARARGLALATSHAREATSAPILERMGFGTICRFAKYFSEAPDPTGGPAPRARGLVRT